MQYSLQQRLFITLALLALLLVPAAQGMAEPPGGIPPGQAKKMPTRGPSDAVEHGHRGYGDAPGERYDDRHRRGGNERGYGHDKPRGWEAHKGGPPDHAPAHGYRAKRQYRYYPEHNVYYDPDRTLFFYEREGRWVSAPEPPPLLEVDLGGGISLELGTDQPFQLNQEHRRRYR